MIINSCSQDNELLVPSMSRHLLDGNTESPASVEVMVREVIMG